MQVINQVCVGVMYCYFSPKCVLFVLSEKCICRVPLTWDMTNLQVVPL